MRINSLNGHTFDKYHDAATSLRCQAVFTLLSFTFLQLITEVLSCAGCGSCDHVSNEQPKGIVSSRSRHHTIAFDCARQSRDGGRPKGSNGFGLETAHGCRQVQAAVCGQLVPPNRAGVCDFDAFGVTELPRWARLSADQKSGLVLLA